MSCRYKVPGVQFPGLQNNHTQGILECTPCNIWESHTNRKALNFATMGLLAIGAGSALMVLFNYLENPHLISKDVVLSDAMKFSGLTASQSANVTAQATLLQIKNNGKALVLDDRTLKNGCCASQAPVGTFDEYVWQVHIVKKLTKYHGNEWDYYIDASNGTVLESSHADVIFPRN